MPISARVLGKMQHVFREAELRQQAEDALCSYVDAHSSSEAERVALAILKLSDGDLSKLLDAITCARTDFRDVLAWAEYPESMRLGPSGDAAEIRVARARDRAQYLRWLDE
jgi:hypothetical protein